MEEKSLSTLEYTKILKSLSECAKNDDAKTMAEELKPSSDFREVERALAETDAAVTMSLKFGSPEILRVEPVSYTHLTHQKHLLLIKSRCLRRSICIIIYI